MLHVFAVNSGHMFAFDVTYAMERVVDLKKVISSSSNIGLSKQVMLISDGEALDDDTMVCNYKAGTENNPIYVFDKSLIEQTHLNLKPAAKVEHDFSKELSEAQQLSPSYLTVVTRTQLALRIHEATRDQVLTMERLVTDEHLMFRGWKAAVQNLHLTLRGFEQRTQVARDICLHMLLDEVDHNDMLAGLSDVIELLGKIPVFPSLVQQEIASCSTLLSWIEQQCRGTKLDDIASDCRHKIQQLTKEKLELLLTDCNKVLEQGKNSRMLEISGINDRLEALDQVILAAKQHIKEQRGIAQGFVRNQETAQDLPHECVLNHDALMTLCESHVTQLEIMRENEQATRQAMQKCDSAKSELAANLHTRLRWLYFVQRSVLNADVKLSMFREQLTLLRHQTEFLAQVQQTPNLYFSLLTECVRRQCFSQQFTQWTNVMLTSSKVARDREIVRRKEFKSKVGRHFIQKLFPGFSDRPPSLSRRPLRKFDLELPRVSREQLTQLVHIFPTRQLIDPSFSSAQIELPPWQEYPPHSTMASPPMMTSQVASSSVMTSQVASSSVMTSAVLDDVTTSRVVNDVTKSHVTADDVTVSPGGFVVTSMHDVIAGGELVLEFSPPRLASPPNSEVLDIGIPESAEFFSILPPSSDHIFPIKEEDGMSSHVTSSHVTTSHVTPPHVTKTMDKLQLSSQHTTTTSGDESDLFHSFYDDTSSSKIVTSLPGIDELETCQQQRKVISQLRSQLHTVERARDDVVVDNERRLKDSRKELEDVINQLERERRERKLAWEKEAISNRQLHGLQQKLQSLEKENALTKLELSKKIGICMRLESEATNHRNQSAIELASAQELHDRMLQEASRDTQSRNAESRMAIDSLRKDLRLKMSELVDAEDRIQELESQLSEAESKISTIESRLAVLELRLAESHDQLKESNRKKSVMESDLESRGVEINSLKSELKRSEDQGKRVRDMLTAYELQLQDRKHDVVALHEKERALHDVIEQKAALNADLTLMQRKLMSLTNDIKVMDEERRYERELAAERERTLERDVEQIREERDRAMEEGRDALAKARKGVGAAHIAKMEELKQDHDLVMRRRDKEFEERLGVVEKNNRSELDELQADHLAALLTLQKELSEAKHEQNQLQETNNESCRKLAENEEKNKRLEVVNAQLRQRLDDVTALAGVAMISSALSSSNDETETKRTRMDESAIAPPSGGMDMNEYDRQVVQATKQSEDLAKTETDEIVVRRRQMMFNSAIQRVSAAKDAEIERLKKQLQSSLMASSTFTTDGDAMTSSSMSTKSTVAKDRDKISLTNLQRDDVVLVVYDTLYRHHVVYTLGHTIHFLHTDSLQLLGLKSTDVKCKMLARVDEKEYCQAKKSNNRFNVQVGSKFYRVKVRPLKKSTPMTSQSP